MKELTEKIGFCNLPTPLEDLENVSRIMGLKKLCIKRDDTTGPIFGGNKARKLEYLLFQALKKNADTIVTVGSIHSNHAMLTTAAANKLKLKTELILIGEPPGKPSGNLLLNLFLGAETHFVKPEEVKEKINNLLNELKNKGRTPYFIPGGGHSLHGTLAYINFFKELKKQWGKKKKPDYLLTATGTGSTQAGLILGNKIFGWENLKIIGISISRPKKRCKKIIKKSIKEARTRLNPDLKIPDKEIRVYDDFIGEGYGIPNKKTIEAMKFLAKNEGIILDPIYTGKAFEGLLNLINKDVIPKEETGIFLHTGGLPLFFSIQQQKKDE